MREYKERSLNVYLISTSGKDGGFFPVRKAIFKMLEDAIRKAFRG